MEELLKQLPDLFSHAHPLAQLAILAGLILGVAYFAFRSLTKGMKLKEMRAQRNKALIQVQKLQGRLRKLRTRLEAAKELADQGREEVQRLTVENGRLSSELQRAQDETGSAKEQLKLVRDEADALLQRFNDLQKIDADIWAAPSRQGPAPPPFIARSNRRTRFVAFLNLKGGVGKTTLVANLAGAYATGVAGSPLYVLVVDLDSQGTLSNMCVSRTNLDQLRPQKNNWNNNRTSYVLLTDESQTQAPAAVIAPLLAPFEGAGTSCSSWGRAWG